MAREGLEERFKGGYDNAAVVWMPQIISELRSFPALCTALCRGESGKGYPLQRVRCGHSLAKQGLCLKALLRHGG